MLFSDASIDTSASVQVIGLGRVGLPLAVLLASTGRKVVGVDTDPEVRRQLRAGIPPFGEPGLAERLKDCPFRVVAEPEVAKAHILAVPTPLGPDRRADLSALDAAVQALGPRLREGDLVVLESTCPPGTTEAVARRLRNNARVRVGCVTERVLPGRVLDELERVERVVGGIDEESARAVEALYAPISRAGVRRTDARTAEVVKLVENAYRDVNVAFANEVEQLCRAHGVDGWEVRALANRHPRVNILASGPGVGGHCLPVDPWFLVQGLPQEGALIRAARAVNDARPAHVIERILARVGPNTRVGCLGLTYKPDSDDLRGAPALWIVERLREALPGRVRACDPFAVGRVPFAEADPVAVIEGSDLIVALVAHRTFRSLPQGLWAGRDPLDLCGCWSNTTFD